MGDLLNSVFQAASLVGQAKQRRAAQEQEAERRRWTSERDKESRFFQTNREDYLLGRRRMQDLADRSEANSRADRDTALGFIAHDDAGTAARTLAGLRNPEVFNRWRAEEAERTQPPMALAGSLKANLGPEDIIAEGANLAARARAQREAEARAAKAAQDEIDYKQDLGKIGAQGGQTRLTEAERTRQEGLRALSADVAAELDAAKAKGPEAVQALQNDPDFKAAVEQLRAAKMPIARSRKYEPTAGGGGRLGSLTPEMRADLRRYDAARARAQYAYRSAGGGQAGDRFLRVDSDINERRLRGDSIPASMLAEGIRAYAAMTGVSEAEAADTLGYTGLKSLTVIGQ